MFLLRLFFPSYWRYSKKQKGEIHFNQKVLDRWSSKRN